jgi:hypothetical protein
MPIPFPSDSSPFLKIIESPLNLQILFHITVFADLTLESLAEKMRNLDKKTIRESVEKMVEVGLVEEYISNDDLHFKTPSMRYQSKEYEDFKEFNEVQLREHLNEEFIFSYRVISLLQGIFGKLIHYLCDFYINRMQNDTLNLEELKQELKYDVCVPRIGFVSKNEFEIYKKRFLEFENNMIDELLMKRKSLGIEKNPNIEYIIANLFIPIKKVIDHK